MHEPDNETAHRPTYRHPLEKGEVVQLCAGMPQVATRDLESEEFELLHTLQRVFLLKFSSRALLAVLLLGGTAVGAAFLLVWAPRGIWYDALAVGVIVSGLLLFLLALIQPLDLLLRRYVLKQAIEAGYVRVFEGTLNPDDFTDKSRKWLEKTGLLNHEDGEPNVLELYADHNVVYQVNGAQPDAWISVMLTRAAAVPEDPLILDVPTDWFPEAAEGCMQRRRQTATEHEEILAYANVGRKRMSYIPLLWGAPIFLALVFLMHKLLQLDAALVAWASGAIAGALTIYNVIHTRRKVNALTEDAEFGWIIIFTPDKLFEPGEDDHFQGIAPTEFLPASETLWSFGGKPAAWRYGASFKPRS